jgi:nitrate/TMAO reductase-like tetraheme cytochrome c subunit
VSADSPNRPVIALLTSNWISMLGVALATTAGFSWVFVLPTRFGARFVNPYIGVLVVFVIPLVLLLGLILIPTGIAMESRRVKQRGTILPTRPAAWRRLGIFFGTMSFVNLLIGSQATYRAVQYMDTQSFCGQTCHVMKPEFTAWQHAPHSHVRCVECHIAPGAEGFVRAKMAGAQQLMEVATNSYPRPIPSGLASNKLTKSADTCENCHARDRDIGTPIIVETKYKDDAANTSTQTVLTMLVGGAKSGGIHGAHMGHGAHIRYAAVDAKRQTIPWVEYTDNSGKSATYIASGAKPADIVKMPVFEMQCVDCHNRPAHSFELPDRAIDHAMAAGELPQNLPWFKKKALELLNTSYKDNQQAAQAIRTRLSGFYRGTYPDDFVKNRDTIERAGATLAAIYDRNNFPDLKVRWGTYPNNLGHMDSPGCFRCHDGSHVTADSKNQITNDCTVCHQTPAVDESSPAVLKTLGITSDIAQPEQP